MKRHNAPKPLSVTGQRSELGRLLSAQTVRGSVHFNVAGQQANTLLHDGHAWKDFARVALAMPGRAPSPRVPGWKPASADYREGLDGVVEGWEG